MPHEDPPPKTEDNKQAENIPHDERLVENGKTEKMPSWPFKLNLNVGYEENYDSLENVPSPMRKQGYEIYSLWQGDPQSKGLRLFMDKLVWHAMWDHAVSDTTMEVAGDIFGGIYKDADGPYIDARGIIPSRFLTATRMSARDTTESKQHFLQQRRLLYPDLKLVVWYHTHPDLGVFLSGNDRRTKQITYPLWYQVAIVIDPIKKEIGFFYGQKQELKPVSQVYLYQTNRLMDRLHIIEKADGEDDKTSLGGPVPGHKIDPVVGPGKTGGCNCDTMRGGGSRQRSGQESGPAGNRSPDPRRF
jgi:proteasome lid subunit RPN8/RPN11